MKGQDKTPEKQPNEVDTYANFQKKMIQDLGKRMEAKIEKMKEMLTKELAVIVCIISFAHLLQTHRLL